MLSSSLARTAVTARASCSSLMAFFPSFSANQVRTKSSKSKKPVRKGGYYARLDRERAQARKFRKISGPKEPNDISTGFPKIDGNFVQDENGLFHEDDDLSVLGPLMGGALRSLRKEAAATPLEGHDELEGQLKLMDFFTSAEGSTEDLVGARRAVAADTSSRSEAQSVLQKIDALVEQERFEYMELPKTENRSFEPNAADETSTSLIPKNQLAHGDWGEMLIRTDRVSKMWRGGRVVSFRALVIGGNLRGCGGFGVGKAFEPEDAVEIACRMAKRNIFFVDRFKGRTLSRDLVGRQNSCKVVLRTTTNGLRGNPLCCEILKLMGITNVVAKAYGSRNHHNVVRATYKALMTHESLDEVALKRGLRLVNLQRAKRLGI